MNVTTAINFREMLTPTREITFWDNGGRLLGRLRWPDGALQFEGNADESARVFFESVLKPLVDGYIATKSKAASDEQVASA